MSTIKTETDLVPKSEYEESALLKQLGRFLQNKASSSSVSPRDLIKIRRLYRKLAVRRAQRRHGCQPFDLVKDFEALGHLSGPLGLLGSKIKKENSIGFQALSKFKAQRQIQSAEVKIPILVKQPVTLTLTSSYTGRTLKPYVRRDTETDPLRLQLFRELLSRDRKSFDRDFDEVWLKHAVDYVYVQRQHIEAVNALASVFFWPGIDVSEALEHPDFSCIAMYKQLVIGFAFLLPNVSVTEAYITFLFVHPDWRRAGIGKFMLYHLIQTCSGKDIVLHVSANNPAVILYQKFGFKVEERVVGFYEKYLPLDSTESRDALFLRLVR